MTRDGAAVHVTAREVAWITTAASLVCLGFWLGVGMTELRSEVRGLRRDICRYAIPESDRRFADSCQAAHVSGLSAQSTP